MSNTSTRVAIVTRDAVADPGWGRFAAVAQACAPRASSPSDVATTRIASLISARNSRPARPPSCG
ncbi:hypothetical protein [Phenylobacterium sp. J367]|uniref:hypothetical protein n=1 Tax=Phenylobacterium sp. J367 TaxID=2898435 RepID=UPI002151450E|nr:hypothetical protein [Phenylobacterium sp. J367]MCR5877308.1 hypothetical protein [Phenylobacterium sp. J367]